MPQLTKAKIALRRNVVATYEERLQQITGGRAPEEGDFNTARLTASDTPPSVRRAIMAELQSVEHGVSDQDIADEMDGVEPPTFHVVKGQIHNGEEYDCEVCYPDLWN